MTEEEGSEEEFPLREPGGEVNVNEVETIVVEEEETAAAAAAAAEYDDEDEKEEDEDEMEEEEDDEEDGGRADAEKAVFEFAASDVEEF